MKKGIIHIIGHIGDIYDNDGNVKERGVHLSDVVMQVAAQKDCDEFDIIIFSPGGSIDEGKAIAEYITKMKKATTIADKYCASMGTEIHLARPLAERKITAGTEYLIHCPLLQNVTGNADELKKMADYIKQSENEMLSMYVKATGADKAAIHGLMKRDTGLTADECKTLGFVSEILPATQLKAVAFKEPTNKKTPDMEKTALQNKLAEKEKSYNDLKSLYKKATGKEYDEKKKDPVALDLATEDGKTLNIEDVDGDGLPGVGDAVSLDGNPTPDVSYTLADGTVIKTDADSKITEVTAPQASDDEIIVEGKKVKVDKAVATAWKKKNDEVAENKKAIAKLAEKDEAITKIAEDLKKMKSVFTPPQPKLTFAEQQLKNASTQEKEVSNAAQAHRDRHKNAKKKKKEDAGK